MRFRTTNDDGLEAVEEPQEIENRDETAQVRPAPGGWEVIEDDEEPDWPADAPSPEDVARWLKSKTGNLENRVFSTREVAKAFEIDEELARRLLESHRGVYSKEFDCVTVWW